MATLSAGYVTSITKNVGDPTKVNVAIHAMGFNDPTHEGDFTLTAADPQMTTEAFDALCINGVKQWVIDNWLYSFGANDDAKVLGSAVPVTTAYPSRTLNSAFQISTTRNAVVNYSVDISTTLSLTGGQTGTVFLEIANDSGFTSGVQELSRFVNGNTGTLTIGLNITQNSTGQVSGLVPLGKYARLRTANTTGSPTFTFRSAQEALI